MQGRRDVIGSVLGILVFLGGVALLIVTFRLAFDMFRVPPQTVLSGKPGQPLNLQLAGTTFVGVILRILLLLVMGFVSSLIANRGIHLYTHSHGHRGPASGG
jgi:hypothetical protein